MSGYSADWLDRAADSRLEEARREQDREWDDHIRARDERAVDRFRARAGMGESKRDPKPVKRQKLTAGEWRVLRERMLPAVSQLSGHPAQSLHHLVPKSLGGDDCFENLMWLTGDGTRGEHGLVEARDPVVLERVRLAMSPAQYDYCLTKLGADRLHRMYPLIGERAGVMSEQELDEWVALFSSRNDIAEEYAGILARNGPGWGGWLAINQAILRRWSPAGLSYIKTRAWKIATQDL